MKKDPLPLVFFVHLARLHKLVLYIAHRPHPPSGYHKLIGGTMRVFMSVACQWMVFVAMTSIAAMAQTSGVTADLAGTVFDQTGAVLPGVMITVTGNSTGLTRTVVVRRRVCSLYRTCLPERIP